LQDRGVELGPRGPGAALHLPTPGAAVSERFGRRSTASGAKNSATISKLAVPGPPAARYSASAAYVPFSTVRVSVPD
jgi:hypothetical protein